MSDCRHRQGIKRHEFSRLDDAVVVEVMACEKNDECTLVDGGVMASDMAAPINPEGCDLRGEKVREAEGTCCSGGAIVVDACAVYGECVVMGAPGISHACVTCHRHTDRERRLMVCDRCVDRQQ